MSNLKTASVLAVLVGAFWLNGCSSLPSQGPSAAKVESDATAQTGERKYLITDLDERSVAVLERRSVPSFRSRFGDYRPAPSQVIGIGDAVNVTIWEAASGGLFSSQAIAGVTTGSHSAVIPDQIVARDGSITVPYAGRIKVVGLTPPQVEEAIVKNLSGKAIEPQALVTVSRNISNTVTVSGEVATGARVPLTPRGDRLLDVVATTGGIKAPVHETFISLTRDNQTATVPYQALLARPQENIFARPGDMLTLVREPQTFSAFGSTGRNSVVPFDAIGISLEEAVAKVGGLLDSQADAQGVFVLRAEPASLAREIDPSYPIAPGQQIVNVVYRANMKDTKTYFLARRFAVRNKDIVYVAASPINEIQKALGVVGAAFQPAATVAGFCSNVKGC